MVNKIDWNHVSGYFESCNRLLVVQVHVLGTIEVDMVLHVHVLSQVFYFYEIRIIAFDRSKLGKFRLWYVICDKSLYGWEDYASYN